MDPLAQLQDIHLPEQINNYPIAPGWIIVYLLAVAVFIVIIVQLKKRSAHRKNQKTALKQLVTMNNASDMIKLLKWSLLAYFPREHVANLSGESLHNFMCSMLPLKHQPNFEQHCQQLLTQYYQQRLNQGECEQLKAALNFWIKHALPPKKNMIEKLITKSVNNNAIHQEAA